MQDASQTIPSSCKIAALIPAYREAMAIADVVGRTRPQVDLVLVVDDGSPDDTAALARAAGAEVIVHAVNQGKGAAMKTGMKTLAERGYDYIMLLDGDGQHAPEEVSRFTAVARSGSAYVVVGNRFENIKGMPLVRRCVNSLMSRIISNACGMRIPDTQCGFRLIRSSLVTYIMGSSDHFDFETEMLLLASRAGFTIQSVPVSTIYGAEKTKIRPVRDTIKFIKLMLRWRRQSAAMPAAAPLNPSEAPEL
ncbi:glycosyltransferase family 2 protein [Prosthecobacter sp.]|uniref:glycosyltransferase family 2 protein n=1 Tax=Prosthecobacter sp. TaxID=1965333 RepID=UPI0037839D7C